MRLSLQFKHAVLPLWVGMAMMGKAHIDSGGAPNTVGAYANHDSIGAPFATDTESVGTYANHPGLIEVIYPVAPALDPNADTDTDGLPDVWEVAHFGSIRALPGADADGDGTNNLMEYLAGTDPADAASVFRPTVDATGDDLVLSMQTIAGRRYRVWGSSNLKSWTALDTIAGDGNPAQFLHTSSDLQYFLKVEILLP